MRRTLPILLISGLVVILAGGFLIYRRFDLPSTRSARVLAWLRDPQSHSEWSLEPLTRCGDAPFVFPTRGFVGYLRGDRFRIGKRHQGIDIFGGTDAGLTPVYAAYPGYLTRLPDWKSSLIIRIPSDPLEPSRQVWAYYTHMADPSGASFIDPAFPPGTSEVYVEAGILLGTQGNYSGDPTNPVGVHLHFSLVKDDGTGRFLNELEFDNTLDLSPYFNLPLEAAQNKDQVPVCP